MDGVAIDISQIGSELLDVRLQLVAARGSELLFGFFDEFSFQFVLHFGRGAIVARRNIIMVMEQFDVYTLGFSTREWDETVEILRSYSIERLIDIRTLPGSKRTPQFNLEHMKVAFPKAGIDYVHMKELGGLRKPRKDSINLGWRNDSFRGYADYMQTPEFDSAVLRLEQFIRGKTSVFACTEAVFWRCHRQLVADVLVSRGLRVGHIFSATKVEPHKITNFARVANGRVTYPNKLEVQQRILDGCD
jgi:uncharacterized protein (DUF488 family)